MRVWINVKGASKKVTKIEYPYPFLEGEVISMDRFLEETVRYTRSVYSAHVKESTKSSEVENQDIRVQHTDLLVDLLKVLSKEEIEEKAETGKVSFGIHYNRKEISEEKAIQNAKQCFLDGVVCVFIDGKRYEKTEDTFCLTEGSEVTFVKLTFLAGRMW